MAKIHGSEGKMPAKGPKGSPHVSMGELGPVPDNTRGARIHGGVAGGASPVNNPKVRSKSLPGGKPLSKW